MFCPFCGNAVQTGMSFCPNCGKDISQLNKKAENVASAPAPAQPVKKEQPVAKPVEVAQSTDEQYDVVLLKVGKNKLNILKIIQIEHKVTLAQATDMISELPLVIQTMDNLENANEFAETLELLGAKAKVEKRTEQNADSLLKPNNSGLKVVVNNTSDNEQLFEFQQEDVEIDMSGRGKFKAGMLLKMFASISLIIAILSIFFLPLFVTLDSLFSICYISVKSMFIDGFSLGNFYGIIYLIIAISIVGIGVSGIVNLVKQICVLAKLDEYYKKELTRQHSSSPFLQQLGSMKYKQSSQNWIGLITDVIVICFLIGFKYVLISSLIISGIFIITNVVMDKIGSYLIKKIFG